MKTKSKSSKGYSLLEIVIVVAVLAVICAILIPVFAGVINTSSEISAAASIKNTYMAYITENPEANIDPQALVYSFDSVLYYMSENGEYIKLPDTFPNNQLGAISFKSGKCRIYDISNSTLICYLAYLAYTENTGNPIFIKEIDDCVFHFKDSYYKFDTDLFKTLTTTEQSSVDNALQNSLLHYKYESNAHKVEVLVL